MIDAGLMEILVCPVTKTPIKPLSADRIKLLNEQISGGGVRYVDGSTVESPLDEGLITQNGKTIYRIDDGIPVMLEDQGIHVDQLDGF